MTWLPSALVFSAISSSLLAATFLHVWYAYVRRTYVLVWSLAWWAAVGHLISGWWSVQYGGSTANWVLQQLFLVTNATLMLAGCWTFTRGRRALVASLALATPFLAWVAVAPQLTLGFTQIELPGALLLAAAYSATSYRFFAMRRDPGARGATLVAVLFAIAALHELDYPVLRQVDGFAPVGYALAATLAAAIALCLLVMILEQARATTQAALTEREVLARRLSDLVKDLDRKVLERTEELEQATRAAQVASNAKSEFLARMSHEIRTPLNGIIGVVDLMERREFDREAHELIDIARQSAVSLMAVVEDVLDFSKIEAGKLELEAIAFSPQELCEEVAELLADAAYSRELELVVALGPDLPDRVVGDPTRLRQILINLTGNAVKFTPKGRVVLRADFRSPRLRCEVEDTGIGLSTEARSHIFEAFSQADSSTTRRYGGTGLGLAITQRLVEQMGGRLGLTSEEGVGSTFWFEVEAGVDTPRRETPEVDLASKRVLVCARDGALREALRSDLESWGARCHTAPSLPEATLGASDPAVDILVCEEGLESASARDTDPRLAAALRVRLVPFSARARRPSQVDDCAVCKPVTRSRLAAALGAALVPGAAADRAAKTVPGARFVGCRILLVEDEPVNALVASSMLEKLGATVDLARNGAEGVACAEDQRFDLVFLDCEMPEMDGYTAIAEMRRGGRNQATPVVALTAHASASDRQRCLEAGMDDYVAKPVTLKEVEAVLARWLRRDPGGRHVQGPKPRDARDSAAKELVHEQGITGPGGHQRRR